MFFLLTISKFVSRSLSGSLAKPMHEYMVFYSSFGSMATCAAYQLAPFLGVDE